MACLTLHKIMVVSVLIYGLAYSRCQLLRLSSNLIFSKSNGAFFITDLIDSISSCSSKLESGIYSDHLVSNLNEVYVNLNQSGLMSFN